MFHTRSYGDSRWLALALIAALLAVPALAQGSEEAPKKTDEKAQAKPEAQAGSRPAAKAEGDAAKGVVLRPKTVDGSVSAYSAAVRKADPEVRVFTNADLETMWAGDSRAWATTPSGGGEELAPAAGETGADLLKKMEDRATAGQERAKSVAEAEQELAQANAAVANLEKQLLAIRNPFAARPQLSEEEQAARADGDTTPRRLARAQEQLDEARERVRDAEAKLNQARRSR